MRWVLEILVVLLVWIAYFSVPYFTSYREEQQSFGWYPTGHYIARGIAIGSMIGLPVGVRLNSLAFGMSLGIPVGLMISAAWERQHWAEAHQLSARQRKGQRRITMAVVALALLELAVFVGMQVTNVR